MFSVLVIVFVFLLPLIFSFASNQIFEVNKFFLFLLFTGIFGIFFAFTKEKWKVPREFFWLAGLVLLLSLSCFFAPDSHLAWMGGEARHQGGIFWIAGFLNAIFFAWWKESEKNTLKIFENTIFSTGIVVSIFAILQFTGTQFLSFFGESCVHFLNEYVVFKSLAIGVMEGRSFATLGQPNFLAQFLLVPFAFAIRRFFAIHSLKNFEFFWAFFGVALFSFALALTGSRAGMMGGFIVFLLFFGKFLVSFAPEKKQNIFFFSEFLAAAFTFFVGIFLALQNMTVFAEIFGDRTRSIFARFFFWQDGFPLLFQNPFFGLGAEHIGFFYEQIASKEALRLEGFLYVPERLHSFFLDTALSFGIPFDLVFFGGIFWIFSKFLLSENMTQKPLEFTAFAACVGLLTAWTFGFPVTTDFFFFFALFGFLFSPSSQKIPELFSKIVLVLFSLLFLFVGTKTLLADIAFYSFQTTEKTSKNLERMLKNPQLESGFLSGISFLPLKETEKFFPILERKKSFSSCLLQLQIVSAQKGFLEKNLANECEKRAGNVLASLLALANFYDVLHEQDRKNFVISKSFSLFPENFFTQNGAEERKFWKDHPDVFQHYVSDFLPINPEKNCEHYSFVKENFFPFSDLKTSCP